MIRLTKKMEQPAQDNIVVPLSVTLPIDLRVKSRVRVTLDDGREAGLFLPRGQVLRGGDVLQSDSGLYVQVIAAPELVSTVTATDTLLLMKAAYHLGNRHVPLQVEPDFLRYRHDHTLDDMVQQMGLNVSVRRCPFEPEAGAYQQAPHQHHHDHHHDHGHHEHTHSHQEAYS